MKVSALDLRNFAALVELGGFSAAARKLGAPKSTLSRQLAALETRLGARLFERSTRRLRLTEAGAALAAYARRVAEEIDNAEAAMEALRERPRGLLVVSAPYSFVLHVLAPRLDLFRAACPEVRLSLIPSAQTADFFADGIDVAIRIGDIPASSLIARKLGQDPLVLVASPGYLARRGEPLSPQDLSRHSLIELRSRAADGWTLVNEAGVSVAVATQPALATPEPSVALDLAERGHGVATAPRIYAGPKIAAGSLVRVLPQWRRGERAIHAVYPSRRLLTPKLRAFLDFTAAAMRAAPLGAEPASTPERTLVSEPNGA